MTASTWIKLAALLLVVAGLYSLPSLAALAALLDPDQIRSLLEAAGPAAPAVLIGLVAAAVVVSPLPGVPLDVAGGLAFGPWLGTLYAALGGLGGSLVAFAITRLLGREFVERLVGGHISFCTQCSDKLLFRVVLVARLLPFLSFDVISYGAGLTKMSASRFALATLVGMLPWTFVYTSSGAVVRFGGATVVTLAVVAVALFLLLPRWIERNDLLGLRKYFVAHLEPDPSGPGSEIAGDL